MGIALILGCLPASKQLNNDNLAVVHKTDSELERGRVFHRAGNLQAAADAYKLVLQRAPSQPEALYGLGCIADQTGNSELAIGLLDRAVALKPDDAEFYNALGVIYAKRRNYDEPELNFRQAIHFGSRAELHSSLGTVLMRQERVADAILQFERAIALGANDPDDHFKLGQALESGGRPDDAAKSYQRALEKDGGHARSLASVGRLLRAANRDNEAEVLLGRAISPISENATRLCDLGDALQESGDFEAAAVAYRRALTLNDGDSRAWQSCGCAELARGEFAPAIVCFEKAIEFRPDWLEARHNLGTVLYELGQVTEAYVQLKQCAAYASENAKKSRETLAVIVPGAPQADNESILEHRRQWVKDISPRTPQKRRFAGNVLTGGKLRIGYVSSFFSRDNWMKPVWALINEHDRSEFEICLFSDAPKESIKHGYHPYESDLFFDITQLSNKQLAELIEKHSIQVLVDLNGYSKMKRLPMFSYRPAPVIVGWFNMYATTGMECFDYLIGDNHAIPPEEERFYVERIKRVSNSYLSFTVGYPVPPVAESPWIKNEYFTFGCLGSQYKITNEVVAAWSSILTATRGSRLLLKNKQLGSGTTRAFVDQLFAKHGVVSDRLILEGPEDHFDFLRAYDKVDLALDTFPYNGGTTTTESIWQGVPVITFAGDRWASRTSASILRAAGLGDFVADTMEDFVSLGTRLASSNSDPIKLRELRANMRSNLLASPVCDIPTFAREMEKLYRDFWRNVPTV